MKSFMFLARQCAASDFLRARLPVALCQDQLYLFFVWLFIIMLVDTWIIPPPPRRLA